MQRGCGEKHVRCLAFPAMHIFLIVQLRCRLIIHSVNRSEYCEHIVNH